MFGRQRKPKLSKEQIKAAIAALENAGKPKPARKRRGKKLGDAARELDC